MWILLFIIYKDGWNFTEQKRILERLYKVFQPVIFEYLDIPYSFAGINFQIWSWKRTFCFCFHLKNTNRGFPDSSVVKNPPLNVGDMGSILGLGTSHMLCRGAKPVCHNYWVCAVDPGSYNYRSSRSRAPTLPQKTVKVKVAQLCPALCNPMDYTVHGILQARILEWVVFPFSRASFPTQGLNPGLPHCGWILYQLSHKGSPRILEWVAYPFSSGSSQPRN